MLAKTSEVDLGRGRNVGKNVGTISVRFPMFSYGITIAPCERIRGVTYLRDGIVGDPSEEGSYSHEFF